MAECFSFAPPTVSSWFHSSLALVVLLSLFRHFEYDCVVADAGVVLFRPCRFSCCDNQVFSVFQFSLIGMFFGLFFATVRGQCYSAMMRKCEWVVRYYKNVAFIYDKTVTRQ